MPSGLIQVSNSNKSIALNDLPDSAWRFLSGQPESGDSVLDALRVPWVYRSINLRAQSISKCPIALMRGSAEFWTTEDDKPLTDKKLVWIKKLPRLIDQTERSLCLWGAAYWLKETNPYGFIGYRWLHTPSITPVYSESDGLVGFDRRIGGESKRLRVDEVVYFWLPNMKAELGPGLSPTNVAMLAAGLLSRVDMWASAFFDRGATPITLLSVEGDPDSSELRRLETWWKRMLGGVRRAFETVAVKASVKPQVIGSPPKDLAMEHLTEAKRQDIATTFGIPYSILFSEATNLATAAQDEWNLWTLGLVPEAEMIEDIINEQILFITPYRFEFQFKKLEIFQHREMEKAFQELSMVEGGVITPNELREQMDMEPMPDGNKLRDPQPPQPTTLSPRQQSPVSQP